MRIVYLVLSLFSHIRVVIILSFLLLFHILSTYETFLFCTFGTERSTLGGPALRSCPTVKRVNIPHPSLLPGMVMA